MPLAGPKPACRPGPGCSHLPPARCRLFNQSYMEKFKIIAKTLAGLEELLAAEVEKIGGVNIAVGTRMVSYVGDKELLYKSNLWLRTALRVLKPIATFEAADPDELYAQVKAIDWDRYIAKGQTIALDTTVYSDTFRHSRYALYRAKDAVCDYFTDRGDDRPKVAVATADVQMNLHIAGTECTLSLDSSGEPLYKRGYKAEQTDAPISEVLAAGILLKAGWDGSRDLIDPMCGSGTFLVEAALIATNTPAGIYRKGFGFERWRVGDLAYDADLWQTLYDDDSQQRDFLHHIYGSDISHPAIEVTEKNVKAAGLGRYITLEVKDFETYEQAPAEGCMVVTNPPYGRRLLTDVPTFYAMIGSVLKRAFTGCEAWIISTEGKNRFRHPRTGEWVDAEPFDFIGLKPSVKEDLANGGLACQLRKYEMFAGRFDAFRAEGGNLDKETAEDRRPKKFTRLRPEGKRREGGFRKDGERKPFGKDRERKPFDKDRERRPLDKDRRPRRDGETERKPFDKDRERKPFDKDRRPRRDGETERKPFDKDRERKPFDKDRRPRRDESTARKPRKFDPNRPLFGNDFDMSQHVLDFTDDK